MTTEPLRLQVFISRSGYCSRRKALELVLAGKVSVNGKPESEPSLKVSESDEVTVNGERLGTNPFVYYLVNKPPGYVTTRMDRFAEKTVMDLLPEYLRQLFPVGRLDKDSTGLILLTNDGPLAHQLLHPKFHVDKRYEVCVAGKMEASARQELERGVMIEGGKTQPAVVRNFLVGPEISRFDIIIREGRKRQIRLMLKTLGYTVTALKRVAFGPLSLGTLKSGQYRQLTPDEVRDLKKTISGESPNSPATGRQAPRTL
jgi:23S rRNA pseudouridine2605 synthase